MMLHLDLEVDDLDEAVAYAVEVGAQLAEHQPQEDVRVMLDPAGHPFCLYVDDDEGTDGSEGIEGTEGSEGSERSEGSEGSEGRRT
jgi:hypothetical protein